MSVKSATASERRCARGQLDDDDDVGVADGGGAFCSFCCCGDDDNDANVDDSNEMNPYTDGTALADEEEPDPIFLCWQRMTRSMHR